ncbi:MAG: bifunctional folylpolyglutamate synthase/dihydrofolate synthase [Planctomycetota bacterium]
MPSFDTYREALDYLFHFTDYERMHRVTKATSVFGLARMNKLLDHCGNPHLELDAVHVAGTKGKGSTAAMTASVLGASGRTVGLYTSPHVYDIRERIQVNGEWIPEASVRRLLDGLVPYLEVAKHGGDTYAPTFFETFTVIAFLYFLERGVDVAVVEVGLGGRLDATNVLQPRACAITPISFDHTEKLGHTLAEIAGEKAGIVKPGVPMISGVQRPEALAVIRDRCEGADAPLHVVGEDVVIGPRADATGGGGPAGAFRVRTWRRELDGLTVPLLGRHQCENAATAIGLADLLHERGTELSDADIRSGLASVRWPGRIQLVGERPEIIVDGAHNPASIGVLLDTLADLAPKRTVFVVAVNADKDVTRMLRLLADAADAFVFTRTDNPRAAPPDDLEDRLAEMAPDAPCRAADEPGRALDLARELAGADDRIVVTGSMYLAGDALMILDRRRADPKESVL